MKKTNLLQNLALIGIASTIGITAIQKSAQAIAVVNINNIELTPNFHVQVTGSIAYLPPGHTHNLVDIPGDPWVSSSKIEEFALDPERIDVSWTIKHMFKPHPGENLPPSTTLMESYKAIPNFLGSFSEETKLNVQHPGIGHVDSLTLRLTGEQNFAGEITSFQIDYIATHVPEPLTILGSFTALGFGALFKKKLSKNKDSKQDC